MIAPIRGDTAFMQQNEEKAIQFRDKHRHIFHSSTKKYNGKILQYYIFNLIILVLLREEIQIVYGKQANSSLEKNEVIKGSRT